MKTREMAEKGELTERQLDKLAIIGVDLTPISAAWLKNLSEMSDYVSRKRVVNLQKANSIKAWIEDQKEAYRKGKLTEAQIKRLEALDPIVFLDFSTKSSSSINAR
jgi:5'-3' exonuclease